MRLMRFRTIFSLLAALSILTVLIAACGKDEPDKVRLALDWYPNANHAGLYIAQEKGYFADEGLEVDMYTPSDPSTVNQTVAAGADDFGINYQPDVLLARAQGVPVVSVIGLVQHPLNSVQVLTASGITRPRDLKGRKIGYPVSPPTSPCWTPCSNTTGWKADSMRWSWSTWASTLRRPLSPETWTHA